MLMLSTTSWHRLRVHNRKEFQYRKPALKVKEAVVLERPHDRDTWWQNELQIARQTRISVKNLGVSCSYSTGSLYSAQTLGTHFLNPMLRKSLPEA